MQDLQSPCCEYYGDTHFPPSGYLEMPYFPKRNEVHCNVRHGVEGRRCYVESEYIHAISWRIGKPYLFARLAKKDWYKYENGVKGGIENIQALKNPVKWVPLCWAENAQHEEED